jgi:hypothetical protein
VSATAAREAPPDRKQDLAAPKRRAKAADTPIAKPVTKQVVEAKAFVLRGGPPVGPLRRCAVASTR